MSIYCEITVKIFLNPKVDRKHNIENIFDFPIASNDLYQAEFTLSGRNGTGADLKQAGVRHPNYIFISSCFWDTDFETTYNIYHGVNHFRYWPEDNCWFQNLTRETAFETFNQLKINSIPDIVSALDPNDLHDEDD